MTDADIERIARRLCAIRGVDPDEKSMWYRPGDESLSEEARMLAWEHAASEVRAWAEVQRAIAEVVILDNLPSYYTPEEREALANAKDGDVVPVKRL